MNLPVSEHEKSQSQKETVASSLSARTVAECIPYFYLGRAAQGLKSECELERMQEITQKLEHYSVGDSEIEKQWQTVSGEEASLGHGSHPYGSMIKG